MLFLNKVCLIVALAFICRFLWVHSYHFLVHVFSRRVVISCVRQLFLQICPGPDLAVHHRGRLEPGQEVFHLDVEAVFLLHASAMLWHEWTQDVVHQRLQDGFLGGVEFLQVNSMIRGTLKVKG
jgi:hypothetical protein